MKLTNRQKGYLFLFGPVVVVYLLMLYAFTGFTLFITAVLIVLATAGAIGYGVLKLMVKGVNILVETDTPFGRWLDRHLP